MDWSECNLVERVEGRCSGQPTIVNTRIFPDTIRDYLIRGASIREIQSDYPALSEQTIEGIRAFLKSRKALAA